MKKTNPKKLPIKKKSELFTLLKDWLGTNFDKVFYLLSSIGIIQVGADPSVTIGSITAGSLALSLFLKHIDIKDQNKLSEILEEIRKRGEVQKGFWTKGENVVRFFQLIDDYLNCKFEENRKIFKKIISKFLEGRIQTYDESDAFFRKAIIEMFPSDIEFLCRLVKQDYSTMEFPIGYSQDDKETSYIKSLVQENPELYRNLEQLIQRGFAINESGLVGGWIYKLSDWGRKFYEYIKQS
jgi:hypothetical protein